MKRHSFYLFCIVLFLGIPNLFSQSWQWLSPGETVTGNYEDWNYGIATDAAGCVYTTGSYSTNSGSYTNFHISLYKYAPNGVSLFKTKEDFDPGNEVVEEGRDVVVSLADNKAIVGGSIGTKPFLGFFNATNGFYLNQQVAFTGSGSISNIDFRNGAVWAIGNFTGTFSPGGAVTFTGTTIPNGGDIFVAKYDLSGNLLAAFHIKGTGDLKGYDIKVDVANNAYITATTQQAVLFQNTAGTTYNPTTGASEVFVAKLNPALNDVLWTQYLEKSTGGFPSDGMYPIALTTTMLGAETFVVGGLKKWSSNLLESFIQQRSRSNATLFSQEASIPSLEIRDLVAPDCSSAGIYATGRTIPPLIKEVAFLSKFDKSTCAHHWDKFSNGYASGEGVADDGAGNQVLAGTYSSTPTTFSMGGFNLAHPHPDGAFAGKFRDQYPCCQNRGLVFDGVDDYVETALVPNLGNGNFTFEAWVYSIATGTGCTGNFRRIVGWEGPGSVAFEVGECSGEVTVYYNPGNTYLTATGVNIRGGWHHVAVTKASGTLTVYVDGVQMVQHSSVILNQAGAFRVGRATGTANNGMETWRGRIDEVRLWKVAKNQTSIKTRMYCPLKGNEANLVLYYPFDQGIPNGQNGGVTTAYDYSKTLAHGALHNFALSAQFSNWICANSPLKSSCPLIQYDVAARPRLVEEGNGWSRTDELDVAIYPNPTTGSFALEFTELSEEPIRLTISNFTGKPVREMRLDLDTLSIEVDLTGESPGIFWLTLWNESGVVWRGKVVKE
ncbi:MAG: T9SS type A sorting domain-containing protein [Saprospirales bacterium]|nr:T9SS type A sorting domain-containing protein [Saprospirales bacterium]